MIVEVLPLCSLVVMWTVLQLLCWLSHFDLGAMVNTYEDMVS